MESEEFVANEYVATCVTAICENHCPIRIEDYTYNEGDNHKEKIFYVKWNTYSKPYIDYI